MRESYGYGPAHGTSRVTRWAAVYWQRGRERQSYFPGSSGHNSRSLCESSITAFLSLDLRSNRPSLRAEHERMGDMLLALLAYNGGMTRVRRWLRAANSSVPGGFPPDLFLETVEYPETRNYGRSVMGAAAIYRELYYSP